MIQAQGIGFVFIITRIIETSLSCINHFVLKCAPTARSEFFDGGNCYVKDHSVAANRDSFENAGNAP